MENENPTKKKRGRPRKREKKSERFTVWVSPGIREKLTEEASQLGIALSAYAGDRLSREREVYIAVPDRKQLANLRFQLHKMDANLERIASALEHLIASRKLTNPPSLEWLEHVSDEVCRMLAQLGQNLYEVRPFNASE
jgi:hypothetical protein